MKFDELNNLIPKGTAGSQHDQVLSIGVAPEWSVRVRYPGKYGPDDFVVQVVSAGVWDDPRNFTHGEFFADLEEKVEAKPLYMRSVWAPWILGAVRGDHDALPIPLKPTLPGVDIAAYTLASQVLTVCEYRRYPQGDPRGGGRWLPINFMMALLGGFWSASEATKLMRIGRPILDKLDGFEPYRPSQAPFDYANYLVDIASN